jgi:hypothetical protein
MAPMKSLTPVRAASNSTVAVLVARFTLARSTPAVAESVRSMARAQAAHVIPLTGKSTRSAAGVVMPHVVTEAAHGFHQDFRFYQPDVVLHVAAAPSRSTSALVTPGVPASLRSTCARSCRKSSRGQ